MNIKYVTSRGQGFSLKLLSATDLQVSVPRGMTQAQVAERLAHYQPWIARQQHKQQQRLTVTQAQMGEMVDWHKPTHLTYLGQSLAVMMQLSNMPQRAVPKPQLIHALNQVPYVLIHQTATMTATQMQRQVHDWYRQQAQTIFEVRVQFWQDAMRQYLANQPHLPMMRVWRVLQLSTANTRWGSCTADGVIRLNWRLIHLPLHLVDYVVVHELAHLVYMNHSAAFWQLVSAVLPPAKASERQLKSYDLKALNGY